MDTFTVDLSTEHQYWHVMRDIVEPVVRELAAREQQAETALLIDHESLVLEDGADYYSFDVSLRTNPLHRWRFRYLLDAAQERLRLEVVRVDLPTAPPVPVCTRDVDAVDRDRARRDILDGLQRVLKGG